MVNYRPMIVMALCAAVSTARAAPSDVLYQGRLTDVSGKPLSGPVDVTLKFFHVAAAGSPVLTKTVDDVVLAQGVFSVALPLDSAERDLVFGHAAGAWLEVTAGGRTYPRQSFNAVPYALNVGIQRELQLRADDYVLTLKGNPAASGDIDLVLPADDGANGQVLKTDGAGNLYWDAPPAAGAGMQGANNLSELTDPAAARGALALGNAATRAVGTGAGDVAAGNHGHADATGATAGFMAAGDKTKLDGIEAGADVTDATNVAAAGAVMNGYFGSNGIMLRTGAGSYSVLADNSANWNAAHTDRLKWDGGATGLSAATGRTSLGLGTMATQDANNVAITGGSLTGVTFTSPAFADDGISGNKIHGGAISAFASTGIDDNADSLAMTIDANENVGIGTASPAQKLSVADTAASGSSMLVDRTITTSANGTTYSAGLNSQVWSNVASGVTNGGHAAAATLTSYNNSAGSLAATYGLLAYSGSNTGSSGALTATTAVQAHAINAGSGTITSANGLYALVQNIGSGSVTNGYGVLVGDVQATNDYGVYQVAADDSNYFAGNVGIGTTSPSEKLEVNGRIKITGGSPGAGKVLVSDAAGVASWGNAGGAMVLLSTQTASNSADIRFTGLDGTYKNYVIVMNDVVPATHNTQLRMQVSLDGGATWRNSAADYRYAVGEMSSLNGGWWNDYSTGTTSMELSRTGLSNTAGHAYNGTLTLFNPAGSTFKYFKLDYSFFSAHPDLDDGRGSGGFIGSTSAYNAVRIYQASGNISSGSFKLYGIQ